MRQELCNSKAGEMIIETIFMMVKDLGVKSRLDEFRYWLWHSLPLSLWEDHLTAQWFILFTYTMTIIRAPTYKAVTEVKAA